MTKGPRDPTPGGPPHLRHGSLVFPLGRSLQEVPQPNVEKVIWRRAPLHMVGAGDRASLLAAQRKLEAAGFTVEKQYVFDDTEPK